MQKHVSVLPLTCLLLLSACERSSSSRESDPPPSAPAPRATTATSAPQADNTAADHSEATQSGVAQDADIPPRKPLDLSFDHLQTEDVQTTEPVPVTETDRLLPDLFNQKRGESPLSVEGELLTDQDAQEFSETLDGAAITIQIKTD